jgi:hypothetical protein
MGEFAKPIETSKEGMMTEWVAVGGGFIEADVIRWKEGVFERRGHRGRRVVKAGDQVMTAEVLKEADRNGWVHLLVRDCKVGVSRILKRALIPVKAGTEIRRAYKTIVKGKPERLLWSDENVQAMLSSQFLGNKEHERFMAMETDEK